MTMLTMALYQWFNAWNCRSERRSLLSIGFMSNKWLILATLLVAILQVLQIYTPFMNYIFDTVPLKGSDWLLAVGITLPILLLEEIRKYQMRQIDKKAD
jgi:Ca2+-transporting ATPase